MNGRNAMPLTGRHLTKAVLASTARGVIAVAAAGSARADTIRIGLMLPYSGINADLGDLQNKAVDLYLKLHGDMVGPHKIEIIKRDEGPASGAQAKTVATELITRDKVQMIAGVVFSPSAIAMAPVLTQAKVPLLIGNAGTAWITNLSPYIARLSFSMWSTGYPMGTYAVNTLACKTAIMGYTDYPPGRDSTEAFKTAFEMAGGKIVDSIPMGNPLQVPDFTPFLERVRNEKPNCFYAFIPSGAHATALVKDYGEVGLRQAGVKLIGSVDVTPDSKLQGMGDAAIGTITMGSYSNELDNPVNNAFVKAWHEAYGPNSYPDFMSAAAWDVMQAIFDTVKKLDGNLNDGQKVMAALKGWTGEGPRGKVEIDPQTRDIIQDEHAFEVVRLPDGKLGHKVLGTIAQVKDECKVLKVGRCGQ
jgi:branched-chain amino acid transport system substrate-binding protein